jgi:RNA polymerase sigma factor (sigma-70 family)
MELEAIISGCVENDRKSQEELYKQFYSELYSYCRRYEHDETHAMDLLQDGFIKIFNKIDTYKFTGNFIGWMKRIIFNLFLDKKRKNKKNLEDSFDFIAGGRNTSMGGTLKSSDTSKSPHILMYNNAADDGYYLQEDFEIAELKTLTRNTIFEAIGQLSLTYRTVFNLYALDGHTHAEIADLLNISVGTSKSNYCKAKRNLRKILGSKLELQIQYT